jgi:hypothetical protein
MEKVPPYSGAGPPAISSAVSSASSLRLCMLALSQNSSNPPGPEGRHALNAVPFDVAVALLCAQRDLTLLHPSPSVSAWEA